MKILNFGSCNIDYTYSVEDIVVPGETASSYSLMLSCGGKGLNQSIAVAKAGKRIFHAGCIGNDGQVLRDALLENGVDTSNLKSLDARSGHAIIQVNKKGENSILLYSGSNEMITKEFIDSVLENFSRGDILLLQNEISNVDYIVDKAHRIGMVIVLNPAPFNQKVKSIDFKQLSYLILNEVEARGLTEKELPDEMICYMQEKYPMLKIVLTLGKKGCIFADKNQTLYQPSFKVETVDTTAAGDTFIGYFIAEIANGKNYAEAIKTACAASALAVSEKGSSSSIPCKEAVKKAVKELAVRRIDKTEYLFEQINRYFEENINTANLNDLSVKLNYSKNYLSELIKRITDKTFTQLLQERRCSFAARLLLETELPIEEIINIVGYQNKSFFRRKFQEYFKTTPYSYRKNKNSF